MNKRILYLIILIFMVTVGCSNTPDVKPDIVSKDKIIVYSTIYPVYDFAQKIGGEKIDLRLMVPPGAEPHDWEPSAKLIAEIEKAHVLIYNGAGMETWIDRIIGAIDNKGLIVLEATKDIDLLRFEEDGDHEEEEHEEEEHEHGKYDPHVWLDPIRAIKMGENIKDSFIEADENNKDYYEDNFNSFKRSLNNLDRRYKEELKGIAIKKIIVPHASFGYLVDRYGLEQISISGITPQEEPSPAKLAEMSDLVKEHNIKYIFFETLTNNRAAEVLAKETNTKIEVLNPIGGLTEKDIKEGKDYFSVMEDNLKALSKALK